MKAATGGLNAQATLRREDLSVEGHCYADGAVRIAGGGTSGRLEVFRAGNWGTLCDDPPSGGTTIDPEIARTACRQLGYFGTFAILDNVATPDGTGPIWFDDMDCTGFEGQLINCVARTLGDHNCTHSEDFGVICGM